MRMSRSAVVLATALCAGSLFAQPVLSQQLTATQAAKLYSAETTYSIFRKGKNIGKHRLTIKSEGDRVDVAVDSNITVTVLKIPVFKFRYQSNEVWEANQLVNVDSTTTTNKTIEKASLRNSDTQSTLVSNGVESSAPLIGYATNHWNISATEQSTLFNTVKGVKSDVTVTATGNEKITIGDKTLNTTHYQYSGDLIVDAWYDDNSRWVKLEFLGSDGSAVTYLIDNP